MKAYIINLDSRPDRWESAKDQIPRLGIDAVRISAVLASDELANKEPYVAVGVSATWHSHQKAMQCFLESEDDYGLILEDDFVLNKNFNKNLRKAMNANKDADFIQLGYLINGYIERLELIAVVTRDILFKFLNRLRGLPFLAQMSFFKKLLVVEQSDVSFPFILHDIRAGGHAYVVSRRFAQAVQLANRPAFTSTDGVYMYMGNVRTFRMIRRIVSMVNQSNSKSSVETRFRKIN